MKRMGINMVKLSYDYREVVKVIIDNTNFAPHTKDQLYWQIHALVLMTIPKHDLDDYKILKRLRRCYL
jgi:hypothetical protein